MRARDSPEQQQYVRLAAENGQLKEVFAALDALGSTAWRINKSIYSVISKVWNSGEALGDIPVDNAESSIPDPVRPSPEQLSEPSYREAHRAQVREVRLQRAKAHSQRCTLNYKLEIARAVSNVANTIPVSLHFADTILRDSTWMKPSISLTISTSEGGPTQFHRICRISVMTSQEVCSSLLKVGLWANEASTGSMYT